MHKAFVVAINTKTDSHQIPSQSWVVLQSERQRSTMGVYTFTNEIHSPVSASRIFNAITLDPDTIVKKIVPSGIKNIDVIQGNGGPGTIKLINFLEGKPFKYVKHRVDALDKEKMTYAYTVFEGDALIGRIESISHEFKISSRPDGGSTGIQVSTYRTKPGAENKEEEITSGESKDSCVFKAVEDYLLAHPDA
ncbi:major allergen Pru ar 1-like [Daucus carota subsp. sativus]|uniref:major allergen Pru ar 1-like n=1 Tax=Daucus carota subsp. sativus TaxID=79200 RepID=UPI0030835AAE